MRLVEKLRRIAAPAAAPLRAAPAGECRRLPGAAVESEGGPYWVRTTRFALDHVHGRRPLGEIAETALDDLALIARDPTLKGRRLRRAVFFDTETTSLGGGVGTYVFLLGAGHFEDDAFVVEQYFLREVTEERALLRAINERLRGFDLAVSFHGKGFDTPRLQGRLVFHGLPLEMPPAHLDLCLVGRSLYRGAFEDCRLQTFERELVGYRRTDDLPGAECPTAFFDHLRGDSSRIPLVFDHNLDDVLTLPEVAARFARDVQAPDHPVVLANLGAFYESAGMDREARRHYGDALEGLRRERHALLPRTLERLALLERRSGRHGDSFRLLLERVAAAPNAFKPLEDLAKYYEHHARDLDLAIATALDARSRLLTGKIQVDRQTRQRHLHAVDHRLTRLGRRAERGSQS